MKLVMSDSLDENLHECMMNFLEKIHNISKRNFHDDIMSQQKEFVIKFVITPHYNEQLCYSVDVEEDIPLVINNAYFLSKKEKFENILK